MKNINELTKYLAVLAILVAGFVVPSLSFAQSYSNLQVSCRPNSSSISANSAGVWYATVSGGNGYYTYLWSGSDGLSGYSNSVYKNYYIVGDKTASVTVSSNGQTITADCGMITVNPSQTYYYPNYNFASINGSCTANVNSAQIGSTVNWAASASGGNGNYTYYWNDNEGFNSGGQYLSRYYMYPGLKSMNLTISSNGASITRSCSVYITPATTVSNSIYPVYQATMQVQAQNQVLSYNASNPNVSAVYLSDVPSTGLDDIVKPVLFAFALIFWSGILAYMFLKKRNNSEVLVPEKILSNSEKIEVEISKDEKDIIKIEEYARIYKVMLSKDASTKILQLAKGGKIDASETIRKMAREDWNTVGENDLEKYL